jgi:short subunit dehydrogenase-like uncharacterized protein
MQTSDFDIILYGATGFTGSLVAGYLDRNAADLRWALAGRSREKLERVREGLTSQPEIVLADSTDAASVDAMAARTRVVLTTTGPYARYGPPVVAACVKHGTHYVDLTGEATFVRRMIDAHHAQAAASGARIVTCCGFDSVPSDIGAFMMAEHLRERGQSCRVVRAGFQVKGGMSGGTAASGLLLMEDPDGPASLADSHYLDPAGHRAFKGEWTDDPLGPWFEPELGRWTSFFFMAPINTRVVRRSAGLYALQGRPYGPQFEYRERMIMGRTLPRLTAAAIGAGMAASGVMGRFGPALALMKRLAPAPGTGPSEAAREAGFTRTRYVALSDGGEVFRGELFSEGDPGYKVTSCLISEAALTLARTPGEALPGGAEFGGVLTPATALGLPYMERLRAAGIKLEVEG